MTELNRREAIVASVGALLADGPVSISPMVTVNDVPLVLADVWADGRFVVAYPVLKHAIGDLNKLNEMKPCPICNGWDGPMIGYVLRWKLTDQWLMADVKLERKFADMVEKDQHCIRPCFYQDYDPDSKEIIQPDGRMRHSRVMKIKDAECLAVVKLEDGYWSEAHPKRGK